MELISIGNHTLIRPRCQGDGHINPLIVCGHLDEEKPELDVEEVGEVRGIVRVPYDETARGHLDYSEKDGNAKCERVRLAVLEGTVEELRQLTLGKCRIVMEKETQLMDLSKELYDDAWNQIYFAQRKINEARRILRDAGAPPDDPSLKLTEEAMRKLSEANRAIVDLEYPKKEDRK